MARFEDADAALDGFKLFDYQKDYGGGDAQSSSIDLQSLEMPQGSMLKIWTRNGSSSDVVDIDLQESADDSSWSDYKTDISTLNDASDSVVVNVDQDDTKQYIRLDYASGDQTVGSSIDVIAAIVFTGSKNSQEL